MPPPSPAGLDGAAWWENDIQSTIRPIQAKLANDCSPPLRLQEVKGTAATQPGPSKASWGVGKEQGWKQGENENRWGRGVDWGGLTAFLVLLCGDSAGQRAQRGENRASEECLLSRSKEHPWGQRKSWSQSPNHPLYHPGPSPAGRWENRVCPHGGQQLQESRTRSLGHRGRLYRQN